MKERQSASRARRVVGIMSGTSLDGLDAALVDIAGSGLSMQARLTRHASMPLGDLAAPLRRLAGQEPMTAGEIARVALVFGEMHVAVTERLLERESPPDLIAAHGQTVYHQPPVSWQLLNPVPIARRCRCPVVHDLRQADLAAGGQGAPITPLADWIIFRDAAQFRTVVNLGGFCNVTILPRASQDDDAAMLRAIRGFDVCACNQVLDAVARRALDCPFDENGAQAAQGNANTDAVVSLLEVLRAQHGGKRSLGTGDEAAQWTGEWHERISNHDLAASAVEAIARCIAEALTDSGAGELIVAGGGALNQTLINRLEQRTTAPVRRSGELGVPVQAREAMAMAVLGAVSADGVPITLPQITGCNAPAPVAGVWTRPLAECVCHPPRSARTPR